MLTRSGDWFPGFMTAWARAVKPTISGISTGRPLDIRYFRSSECCIFGPVTRCAPATTRVAYPNLNAVSVPSRSGASPASTS